MTKTLPSTAQPPLIAHVIYRLGVGGMENGLVNLINQLPKSRYRHVIICLTESSSFEKRLTADNFYVYELHKRDGKDLSVYVRLWKLLRSIRPNILHTRNLGTVDLALVGRLAGVPSIVHGEHGWDAADPKGANIRYRYLRKFCDYFVSEYVAVSRDIADWLSLITNDRRSRVNQIFNGVDSEEYSPNGAKAELPFAGAQENCVVVGTVGRMDPIKNFDVLIDAVKKLLDLEPDLREKLRLVLVGDGPMTAEYRRQVARCGLEQITWFAGEREDVPALLRAMDIFVLPSQNEGISNTILEAMAVGVPTIATNVGGNPELIKHEESGILVPPDDIDALAAALSDYAKCPSVRAQHRIAARKRVETKFSLDSMVRSYAELYERLLSTSRRAQVD